MLRLYYSLTALAVVAMVSGCSRTVKWDEEVLLNTGDKIWVSRSEQYELQGDSGNPLDMAYRIRGRGTIEVQWKGVQYSFNEHGGPLVLAVSPQGTLSIVAQADAGRWGYFNGYRCTVPYYVQFQPGSAGKDWQWGPSIDPWLHNLPANLLLEKPQPEESGRRYTTEEKEVANASGLAASPGRRKIDPLYTSQECVN